MVRRSNERYKEYLRENLPYITVGDYNIHFLQLEIDHSSSKSRPRLRANMARKRKKSSSSKAYSYLPIVVLNSQQQPKERSVTYYDDDEDDYSPVRYSSRRRYYTSRRRRYSPVRSYSPQRVSSSREYASEYPSPYTPKVVPNVVPMPVNTVFQRRHSPAIFGSFGGPAYVNTPHQFGSFGMQPQYPVMPASPQVLPPPVLRNRNNNGGGLSGILTGDMFVLLASLAMAVYFLNGVILMATGVTESGYRSRRQSKSFHSGAISDIILQGNCESFLQKMITSNNT